MSKLYVNSYILILQQKKSKKLIIINKERTQILAEKFFSMFVVIDHLKKLYKSLTASELTLNNYIFTKKVLKTINRLLNEKTTESDKILNEVLKRITSTISINLIHEICTTFTHSLLLTYYKKSIIIILHKKSNKNYSLLKSFRLITLENILAKIIKKMLATCLNYTVKKYSLIF